MKNSILFLALSLSLVHSLSAEDVMVERMQSVVDEVSELRLRYETCLKEVEDRTKDIENVSKKGFDNQSNREKSIRIQELEFENEKLKESKKSYQNNTKETKVLESDVKTLEKENRRLTTSAQILVEKNHSLLSQLSKLKDQVKENGKDTKALSEAKEELAKVKIDFKQSLEATKGYKAKNKELNSKVEAKVKELSSLKKEKVEASTKVENLDLVGLKKENSEYKAENRVLASQIKSSQVNIEAYELEVEQNSKALKKYAAMEKELSISKKHQCKVEKVKKICPDDNPFPKLMMKSEKKVLPAVEKTLLPVKKAQSIVVKTPSAAKNVQSKRVIAKTGTVYRMKREGNVYDDPEKGDQLTVWEEQTSFTSNISQGEWIKATGIFIEQKWTKAKEAYWIRKEDTVKR